MNLSKYDRRYVRIRDKYGESFSGLANYEGRDFLECEYGGKEDGILLEDVLIYNSQIESIEEIEVHGTAELWTDNLILRRYRMEDAEPLYRHLGTDPEMSKYSGWNPYATQEMARETVRRFIESYEDPHSYSWVIAWCAKENTGSCRVLEKSGMRFVRSEKDGISVENKAYDKLIYEYRMGGTA